MTTKNRNDYSVSITVSSTSPNFLAGFIDSLLKAKSLANEGDYSDAIARLMIAKACVDERQIYNAMSSEVLIAANRHAVLISDSQFIAIDDLVAILDDLVNPSNEMIDERVDELESEMSWTEVSKFKEICGE